MAQHLSARVAVLGGGPGGYTAAFRAADLGLEVCLIEQDGQLGGTCLHVGCIPSKTLLHAAAVITEARNAAASGIIFAPPQIELETLRRHKAGIIAQLGSGLAGLAKARRITRLTGRATLIDRSTLAVIGPEGETRVSFMDLILATGSRPLALPDCPSDPRIWDSTTALALPMIPAQLLIIGGGIIGLEMAQVYSALGTTITLVESQDQIIPAADRDLVQPLFLQLKKKYRLLTRTRVTGISADPAGIEVSLAGELAATVERFDAVLVAMGRIPNSQGLGLEAIGLPPDPRGFLPVDQRQQTALPHIYAVGDLVGEPMLAHKASHQAKVAAEVIAGLGSTFAPHAIPAVAYTSPEIAWVGLNEKELERRALSYRKGKFPWGASGRALSAGVATGVSKVLCDPSTGRLLGAGICGDNAGELIHEAALALEMGATAEDIARTVHAHPTLAETLAFAAEMVTGSITDALPPKR